MKPDDQPRLRWFDHVLMVAVVALLVSSGWVMRQQIPESCEADACSSDCGMGPGPCGCDPVYPPCGAPCSGCCPGGCKPPPPNPTAAGQ